MCVEKYNEEQKNRRKECLTNGISIEPYKKENIQNIGKTWGFDVIHDEM